jgi:hypothetical protein
MLLLVAAALSLLHAGRGGAAVLEPAVTVTVDGVAYSVPLRAVSKAAGAGSMNIYAVDNYSVTVQDQYSFTISSARLDPDPSIAYALSVTDFGAASTFSFLFGTPIVSTGSPNLVSAGLAGTLTDGGSDGVTITPMPMEPKIQASGVGFPLTEMGVGVDLGESGSPSARSRDPSPSGRGLGCR